MNRGIKFPEIFRCVDGIGDAKEGMCYLLCTLSPGNFLIELLPGLFELTVVQADLLLKIFKSFQKALLFGAGLIDIVQTSRRKKILSVVSILICITVCKSDARLIKGD